MNLKEIVDRYDEGYPVQSPPPEPIDNHRDLDLWMNLLGKIYNPTRRIPIDGGREVFEFELYDVSDSARRKAREHIDKIHEEGYSDAEKDDIIGPYIGMNKSGCLIDWQGDEPQIAKFVISLKESSNPPRGPGFLGFTPDTLKRLPRLEKVVKRCNAPEKVKLLQQPETPYHSDTTGKAVVTNFDTDLDPDLFFEFAMEMWFEYKEEFSI